MDFKVRDGDAATVHLDIEGALTQKQLHDADQILKDLIGDDVYSRRVLINLTSTNFIDSSGINWLLVCHKRFIENDGRMVLHSIPPLVDNVLKILRMESVFETAADESGASQLLQSSRPAPAPPKPPETPPIRDEEEDEESGQDDE